MIASCRPLIEVLAEIPDSRQDQGKRHPLSAILALVCVAVLCGYKSYSAMAEWARNYPRAFVDALGFTHPTPPCAATLHTVLRQIDREHLERVLGVWAEDVLGHLPLESTQLIPLPEAVALDGKTLRGSRRQGALHVHLLSAVSHRLGLTLGQQAVEEKTNEITVALPLLQALVLEGRIVTMDALLTQRAVAEAILAAGGDYVMLVKGNQPRLEEEIALVFTDPPPGDQQTVATTRERRHGRLEQRRLTISSALASYSDWPGLQQVFRVDRTSYLLPSGKRRAETVYGVTSLTAARASAVQVLALTRHHWRIENGSHWIRDVTFQEDASQVRCGSIPQVMAAFRNTAIGLLRASGATNIAAATRRLAAHPRLALALIGLTVEN